jgi:hypothetical protein
MLGYGCVAVLLTFDFELEVFDRDRSHVGKIVNTHLVAAVNRTCRFYTCIAVASENGRNNVHS